MAAKLEWTLPALADLEAAFLYIFDDNPSAARGVRDRIRQSTERLADFPESGRPGRREGTRELVIPGLPYIIVYRIRGERVQLLRVLHTSRRWPS